MNRSPKRRLWRAALQGPCPWRAFLWLADPKRQELSAYAKVQGGVCQKLIGHQVCAQLHKIPYANCRHILLSQAKIMMLNLMCISANLSRKNTESNLQSRKKSFGFLLTPILQSQGCLPGCSHAPPSTP